MPKHLRSARLVFTPILAEYRACRIEPGELHLIHTRLAGCQLAVPRFSGVE